MIPVESFPDQLIRLAAKYDARAQNVFFEAVHIGSDSVIQGSDVTGSAGQPVADVRGGTLRGSFETKWRSSFAATTSTNILYAPSNEDGVARPGGGPYELRASVGGRHSVKLTIVGWQNIVAEAMRRVRANA